MANERTSDAAQPLEAGDALAPPMEEEVQVFLDHLALERRLSVHTLAAYGRDVRQFAHFLCVENEEPVIRCLAQAGKPELRRFMRSVAERVGANTLARKMASLRAFYRFLFQVGRVNDNPAQGMKLPRVRRHQPVVMSAESAEELLEEAQRGDGPRALRDIAVLELLYGSGLRVSEVTSLDLDAVDMSARKIRVLGKGKKERIVPLTEAAVSALGSYLTVRKELLGRDREKRALFLGMRGKRLGVRRVQEMVQALGKRASGRPDLHPHALRHACATHMLEGGADLRMIQEFLGHESVATTQRYTHLSDQALSQVYDRAFAVIGGGHFQSDHEPRTREPAKSSSMSRGPGLPRRRARQG